MSLGALATVDLVFGWRTAILALVSVQVAMLAIALALTSANQPANRFLAALLLVLIGLLTPYTIGFAGFYDAFPWLSFAPFALPLALGPLAFAYVCAWTHAQLRIPLRIHLVPAALHFAYGTLAFLLPPATKSAFAEAVDGPIVAPLIWTLAPVSLAAYTMASLRALRTYRRRLAEVVTDEARFSQGWLGRALVALAVTIAVWSGFQLCELFVTSLDYFQRLGLYLVLAALALYLAIEGWRHAHLRRPQVNIPPLRHPAAEDRDWVSLGTAWAARVDAEGWWRDPELTLPSLAARLGTNTHYLSRALNEGLGQNFAAFINARRTAAVRAALDAGSERTLLDLALDAGFASKASFNRAYRAAFDESPSAVRRRRGA